MTARSETLTVTATATNVSSLISTNMINRNSNNHYCNAKEY